jgi:hypothetical protein
MHLRNGAENAAMRPIASRDPSFVNSTRMAFLLVSLRFGRRLNATGRGLPQAPLGLRY